MNEPANSSARRVQETLNSAGISLQVIELPESTRTAVEAAQAIGSTVAQIAKSLIFKLESGEPILVIASGVNRVNERTVGERIGEKFGKADANFVREQTGYVIGGVPPVGHIRPIRTLIDQDLLVFNEIWAAAGTPNAVFRLTPADLLRLCGDEVLDIK